MRIYLISLIFLYFIIYFVFAKVEENQKNKIKEKQSNLINEDEENKNDKIDLSNGFGSEIEWVNWNEAISIALDLNKPIFLLIHKTWCGACQALKKSFLNSNKREELIELSKQFIMVNLEDDDEPEEEEYAPDGRYIPRLFILNKKGQPLDVDNAKNYPNNKQYFPQVPDVIRAMKLGLKKFEESEEGGNVDEEKIVKKEEKKEENNLKETIKDEKKKKQNSGGGCPHAAGKAAAKKAEDEEEKNKKKVINKDKNVKKEEKKANDNKIKKEKKDENIKKEKSNKIKDDKKKLDKKEKKIKKEKEEL